MAQDCIFCKIVAGELPCDKVFEDDEFIVFKDINPPVSYSQSTRSSCRGYTYGNGGGHFEGTEEAK